MPQTLSPATFLFLPWLLILATAMLTGLPLQHPRVVDRVCMDSSRPIEAGQWDLVLKNKNKKISLVWWIYSWSVCVHISFYNMNIHIQLIFIFASIYASEKCKKHFALWCVYLSINRLSSNALCVQGWPWTTDPPASTFWMLGLQVFPIMLSLEY